MIEMTDTEAIRAAIASGEMEKATALWNDYAARLEEEIRSGACSAGRMEEARDLVEWSRITVLCARSHEQDDLNSMHAAMQYNDAVEEDPALVRVYS